MDKRDLKVELLRFEGKTTQSLYHGGDVCLWTGGSFWFSLMELWSKKSAQILDLPCRILFGGGTLMKRPDRSIY